MREVSFRLPEAEYQQLPQEGRADWLRAAVAEKLAREGWRDQRQALVDLAARVRALEERDA
jgi:hypothetical protein